MKNRNRRLVAIMSVLACFSLLPRAQAVSPEVPDEALPGGNTAEGQLALGSLTTGFYNSAFGIYSLLSLTDGNFNTGVGAGTLLANTAGENTATGAGALFNNTTGPNNTANGAFALFSNTAGDGNTAVGHRALFSNDTGVQNTAIGSSALASSTTGHSNTASGTAALINNINGVQNTASGRAALFFNTSGNSNTATGVGALQGNSTGNDNTAIGRSAGFNITGNGNVCIGEGVLGVAGENNTTRIRNIYDTVQPVVGTDPDVVTIDSSGKLGRANVSSRRYKHDIKPMGKASEALYALSPVSFRYNKQYDATQTIAFGLIAEDVAEVYPDLVGRNREGQPESVRYEQINAMLLNEFLKEHKKVEEQQATIGELKSTVVQQQKGMEILTAHLKEQAAQIQEVSARLEVSKRAPEVVVNK
jgi:Chaperone of endosialidase